MKLAHTTHGLYGLRIAQALRPCKMIEPMGTMRDLHTRVTAQPQLVLQRLHEVHARAHAGATLGDSTQAWLMQFAEATPDVAVQLKTAITDSFDRVDTALGGINPDDLSAQHAKTVLDPILNLWTLDLTAHSLCYYLRADVQGKAPAEWQPLEQIPTGIKEWIALRVPGDSRMHWVFDDPDIHKPWERLAYRAPGAVNTHTLSDPSFYHAMEWEAPAITSTLDDAPEPSPTLAWTGGAHYFGEGRLWPRPEQGKLTLRVYGLIPKTDSQWMTRPTAEYVDEAHLPSDMLQYMFPYATITQPPSRKAPSPKT